MMKKELISLLLLVLVWKVNSQQLTMDSAQYLANIEWKYEGWKGLAFSNCAYSNPIRKIKSVDDSKLFYLEVIPVYEFKAEAKNYSMDDNLVDFIQLKHTSFRAYILHDSIPYGILFIYWDGSYWSKGLHSGGFCVDSPLKLAYEAVVKLKPENIFFIDALYGLFFEKDGEVMVYSYDNGIISFRDYLNNDVEMIDIVIRYHGQMKDTIK